MRVQVSRCENDNDEEKKRSISSKYDPDYSGPIRPQSDSMVWWTFSLPPRLSWWAVGFVTCGTTPKKAKTQQTNAINQKHLKKSKHKTKQKNKKKQ